MAESGADGHATELPAEELPQGGVFVRPRKTKIPVSELLTGIMGFLSNPLCGEIHKSRIRYLADLPQLKKQPQSTDKCLVYANDTLTIKIIFQKFNPQKHAIVYDLEAGFVRSIDGCSDLIGIDDNIPHEEYASVTVKHPAGILEFPTAYITHLYEPSRNNVVVALGKGNSLFISTQNSDGAGGYYAVWTVENYLVKSLFVLHDF